MDDRVWKRGSRRMWQRWRVVKMNKMVVWCLAALTIIGVGSRVPGFFSEESRRQQEPVRAGGFAVVMNTWKRYDLLQKSVSHYATCPSIDSIHIVWSEPEGPSESLRASLGRIVQAHRAELKLDINSQDSLNNRFKEIKGTQAVFSVDDDVIIPCSSVEFAFTVWQSAPNAMVGFVPRLHRLDPNTQTYSYSGWWSVWWSGSYSMVLSKAAFFHSKYLSLYTHQLPPSIKHFITKTRNCEDIAMSFLVANATGAPPIWVKGNIFEIGSTGISSLGGHSHKRSQCLNRFVAEFGRMPLITTSVKAVDSRTLWFW